MLVPLLPPFLLYTAPYLPPSPPSSPPPHPLLPPQGLDFYFGSRAHAVKFVDFLQSVVPLRYRADKQLVSHNIHTSTYNYKYTFSVEMSPVCKVRGRFCRLF